MRNTLLELADNVARRVRAQGWRARTVTLKYRDAAFTTLTRAKTLDEATDSGEVLFQTVSKLFAKVHDGRSVRLVGVSASHFEERAQRDLFAAPPSPADKLRDAVAQKFGTGAIERASLLGRKERRHPEAHGDGAPPLRKRKD